jgi:hypothetical protein
MLGARPRERKLKLPVIGLLGMLMLLLVLKLAREVSF